MEQTNSNAITRAYLDSLLIEQRIIGTSLPSAETAILGRTYATPVMGAAFSHLDKDGSAAQAAALAAGMKAAGALNWWGMADDAEMEAIYAIGADTVEIIKPYADDALVFHRIEFAREHGAVAVGMDIDHAYGRTGYDRVDGMDMRPKGVPQLKEYAAAAGGLPFVVKGVLSVADAERCAEAGAAAIVVSHHHGIFDGAVPPLKILPQIKKAVGGQMEIFADCGFESALDVLKALALGANAAGISRHILARLREGGADAVAKEVAGMTAQLTALLGRTGCPGTAGVDSSIIWNA